MLSGWQVVYWAQNFLNRSSTEIKNYLFYFYIMKLIWNRNMKFLNLVSGGVSFEPWSDKEKWSWTSDKLYQQRNCSHGIPGPSSLQPCSTNQAEGAHPQRPEAEDHELWAGGSYATDGAAKLTVERVFPVAAPACSSYKGFSATLLRSR